MKRVKLVMAFCLGLLLAACAQVEPTPVPEVPPAAGNTITNIVWKWETLDDQAANSSTRVPNPDLYTIVFHQDGTTEGQADCNTFRGTYSQDGGFFITVRPDVMAACDQGSMDQQFLSLLGDIAAGGPDGAGGLRLQTPGGAQQLDFSSGGAAP
jgi:heat shock protein HslJ